MGEKAARTVGQADVNRAVDHRSLVSTGGTVIAFLLALVVLFFVFRPTQFASLIGRTFAPFHGPPDGPLSPETAIAYFERNRYLRWLDPTNPRSVIDAARHGKPVAPSTLIPF